nr:cyclin B [Patiria pectinifera]
MQTACSGNLCGYQLMFSLSTVVTVCRSLRSRNRHWFLKLLRCTFNDRMRCALENISNVAKNNVQAAAKKEIKQKRGMTKSKATSSLQSVIGLHVEPVEKVQSPEPMDMSEVSNALEAFSQNILEMGVDDIDKDDHENPQLCSEYVNDIYLYMRHLEREFKVRTDYMAMQEITERMRTILIDWLVQVHLRFHLLQETLFLTIQILDRYLEGASVSKTKLQLVGVTSMLIAAYEEMYAEIGDFVYITDNAYSKAQIRAMECNILRKLDFNLGKPLCIHFLRRCSKAGGVDGHKHTLSKYIMELTLQSTALSSMTIEIAAAALLSQDSGMRICGMGTKSLVHYSAYSEGHLGPIVQKMAVLSQQSHPSPNSRLDQEEDMASSKFMSDQQATQELKSIR